jgi:Ca2+-binding EF-hand superfamily protein
MKRIAIYPKDIMIITGKSERYSRELLRSIRNQLKKEKHQIITFDEFYSYMGIKLDKTDNCNIPGVL